MVSLSRRLVFSIAQLAVAFLILPTGFIWISWFCAEIPKNTHLPLGWKAGVINHGQYYEWPLGTVADNPIGFIFCSVLLFGEVIFLIYSTRKSVQK